jgi:hypothetical protein
MVGNCRISHDYSIFMHDLRSKLSCNNFFFLLVLLIDALYFVAAFYLYFNLNRKLTFSNLQSMHTYKLKEI